MAGAGTEAIIARLLADIGASPAAYPQKLDLARDLVLLVRLAESDYRAASFLDDRILHHGMEGAWVARARVEAALGKSPALPLHFIFHAGHVGSTLVSRLLDETGLVLSLREPLPLRTLAELSGRAESARMLDALMPLMLRLWSRGFPGTRAVVLKATSTAARLAPRLMGARSETRAIWLNLAPEPYLAALLAGPNTPEDLKGHAPERAARLARHIGAPAIAFDGLSLGELAAMSWLAEKLTERAALATAGMRILAFDFDAFLADVPGAMASAVSHLGLETDGEYLAKIGTSGALSRYSKATEHPYSPELRRRLIDGARREFASEIRKGLAWLEAQAARNPAAAAALG